MAEYPNSKYRNGVLSIFDRLSVNMEYKIFGISMKPIARSALISGLYKMTEEEAEYYLIETQKVLGDLLRRPLTKH